MTFRILLSILIEICVLFKQQAAGLIQHAWRTFLQKRDIQRWSFHLLKIEWKADRTAKGYKFICPIFRLDKTSLHQGQGKLSEQHCLVGVLWWVMLVIKALTKKTPFSHPHPYASLLFIGFWWLDYQQLTSPKQTYVDFLPYINS